MVRAMAWRMSVGTTRSCHNDIWSCLQLECTPAPESSPKRHTVHTAGTYCACVAHFEVALEPIWQIKFDLGIDLLLCVDARGLCINVGAAHRLRQKPRIIIPGLNLQIGPMLLAVIKNEL